MSDKSIPSRPTIDLRAGLTRMIEWFRNEEGIG